MTFMTAAFPSRTLYSFSSRCRRIEERWSCSKDINSCDKLGELKVLLFPNAILNFFLYTSFYSFFKKCSLIPHNQLIVLVAMVMSVEVKSVLKRIVQ